MEPKVNHSKQPRTGRGFSLPEIRSAGVDTRAVKRSDVRIDRRRRTSYDENVKLLEERFGKKSAKKTQPAKGKKLPPPPKKK